METVIVDIGWRLFSILAIGIFVVFMSYSVQMNYKYGQNSDDGKQDSDDYWEKKKHGNS